MGCFLYTLARLGAVTLNFQLTLSSALVALRTPQKHMCPQQTHMLPCLNSQTHVLVLRFNHSVDSGQFLMFWHRPLLLSSGQHEPGNCPKAWLMMLPWDSCTLGTKIQVSCEGHALLPLVCDSTHPCPCLHVLSPSVEKWRRPSSVWWSSLRSAGSLFT